MSGSYFRTSRDTELSILYYLETQINASWTGISTVKSFKEVYAKNINVPIVCSNLISTDTVRLEIGDNILDNTYLISVNIFARSDGQRLDLADFIKDKLKDGWVHYEHSHASGDNTTLTRVASGRDFVFQFITDSRIDIGGESDEKDKFRHNITIKVRHNV